MTLEKFQQLTTVVIDNFEGGYYHPDMLKSFNQRSQDILRASGETMFGLDRKAGSQLAQYHEWKTFWDLVDSDRAANKGLWRYQYRGGKIEYRLKELAAAIMFKWFTYLSKKYILIGSMDEIDNDDRLIIHFSYASWNGEGWFKRYAEALNSAIIQHEGNKEEIFKQAIKARTEAKNRFGLPNVAIRQQGKHMMALYRKLKLI